VGVDFQHVRSHKGEYCARGAPAAIVAQNKNRDIVMPPLGKSAIKLKMVKWQYIKSIGKITIENMILIMI
jgi:hypothetical protein